MAYLIEIDLSVILARGSPYPLREELQSLTYGALTELDNR